MRRREKQERHSRCVEHRCKPLRQRLDPDIIGDVAAECFLWQAECVIVGRNMIRGVIGKDQEPGGGISADPSVGLVLSHEAPVTGIARLSFYRQ